jgi:hypothetical protein
MNAGNFSAAPDLMAYDSQQGLGSVDEKRAFARTVARLSQLRN